MRPGEVVNAARDPRTDHHPWGNENCAFIPAATWEAATVTTTTTTTARGGRVHSHTAQSFPRRRRRRRRWREHLPCDGRGRCDAIRPHPPEHASRAHGPAIAMTMIANQAAPIIGLVFVVLAATFDRGECRSNSVIAATYSQKSSPWNSDRFVRGTIETASLGLDPTMIERSKFARLRKKWVFSIFIILRQTALRFFLRFTMNVDYVK